MDLSNPIPFQSWVNAYSLCVQAQVPCVLIGEPGQAKTSIGEAVGRRLNWHTHVFPVPGKRSAPEVIGLPARMRRKLGTKKKVIYVKWVPYKYLIDFIDKPHGIFMLDDLAEADLSMQATYLSIISKGRFGDLVLPNVSMSGAANPEDGKLRVRAAMSNRICHIPAVMSTNDFADAAMQRVGRNFPDPEIALLDPKWVDKFLLARTVQVAQFLKTTTDFGTPDASGPKVEQSEAFPSPRTWDMVMLLLAAYDAATFMGKPLNDKLLMKTLIEGSVGNVAMTAFATWLAEDKLPTAQEILSEPVKAFDDQKAFTTRKDRLYVMLTVMLRHLMLNSDNAELWNQGWEVLGIVADKNCKPFGVATALTLLNNRPAETDDPPALAKYADIVTAGAA